MEAGPQVIVVNANSGQYFMLDRTIWQHFHQDAVNEDVWQFGYEFLLPKAGEQFSDNTTEPTRQKVVGEGVTVMKLIARFISQDLNSGAMIARRDTGQAVTVFDKRRYKKLCDQYRDSS